MGFLNVIADPLGKFLYWIYGGVNNYGIALIIFTIIVRTAMVPLTLKQYKSTAEMQKVQPLLQEVQRKYANDKEKLNQETMKIYQEHKINPAGGCLPLLIQMPILFALWQVISRPLKFMLGFSDTQLADLANQASQASTVGRYPEIDTITYFIKSGQGDKVGNLNMFFPSHSGLNLGNIPTWDFSQMIDDPSKFLLLILPLLAVVTTYLTARMSMPKKTNDSTKDKAANPMGNSMLYISPLMTLIFSFQFPVGMSLYWFVGNIFSIAQQYYVNKYVLKKKEV
ncbi:YidC/Oxa1 family membrane protein insertase [Ruminiclostridium sufflavum DSM 19573]|uniref:YidC/Oxa1 family membrane protein insertase n=1 Tax=Ruminiclostridium sufflavum DSM 19573 TaxID=1121337 RepID=A0A318XRX0_9FIRM|nr:YidC/Oxa1 family membrane protein insertase [Ruminiclostridium sufflavum]PYG88991.1 YidC/Oxa1 family membrane protein insertase [Ruminiclostridium sufflavum DSM 19573]